MDKLGTTFVNSKNENAILDSELKCIIVIHTASW